jgi:two-component system sensor histidine kinase AtoS
LSWVELLAKPESLPVREVVARVAGGKEKQASAEFVVERDSKKETYAVKVTRLGSGGVLIGLENESAAEYARHAVEWVPVAQKLAHDIKNPLTAMSLALQRVEQDAGADSGRYVESMRDDINRLKKMADGFMRLTKLDPPRLEPQDLTAVVRQCLVKFEAARPAGVGIKLELAEGLPRVALDREQIASACGSIVENGIAAMAGKGGNLTVSTRLDGDKVVITIADTGKGIPERYLGKVFQPFFTLKPGGTGLGMCIAKRVIEEHKGTIAIQSEEGEGTTVTLSLPAAEAKSQ